MKILRILLVEDQIQLKNEIKRILENSGHKVVSISSKELIENENIHQLYNKYGHVDVVLRGKIGEVSNVEFQLAKDKIPIIYMGEYKQNEISNKIHKLNPFAFLVKPFGEDELITTVQLAKKHSSESGKPHFFQLINQKKIMDDLNRKLESIFKEEKYKLIDKRIPNLKHIELDFDRLINENKIHLVIIDKDGFIKYANEAFSKLVGEKHSEINERNIYEYIHPEDVAKVIGSFNDKFNIKRRSTKVKFRMRDYRKKWVMLDNNIEFLVNGDNRIYYSLTSINLEEVKFLKDLFSNISKYYGPDNKYSYDEISRINIVLKSLNSIFKNMSPGGFSQRSEKIRKNIFMLLEFSELLASEVNDLSVNEINKLLE